MIEVLRAGNDTEPFLIIVFVIYVDILLLFCFFKLAIDIVDAFK